MSKAKFLRPGSAVRKWGEFAVLLCIAAFFGYCGLSHGSSHSASSIRLPGVHAASAHKTAAPRLRTKPIEQIRLGERIPGTNPELADEDRNVPEPDPATWRHVKLHMVKDNGSSLYVELLRPLDWIELTGAVPGASIYLDLPEMGAQGDAEVLEIGPCPRIQTGQGNVVTGKFTHQADGTNVIDLQLEGESKPTGVTDNHPYWSLDRQVFVPAGQLRVGERLKTCDGAAAVLSVVRSSYAGPLHNLEVNQEHVYQVGVFGMLVHNSCDTLYRVIRADQDPLLGLVAKNPAATYKASFHVSRGRDFATQFISTTKSLDVALSYARREGLRVVEVSVSKLRDARLTDLTNPAIRDALLSHPIPLRLATSSREVLVEGFIPPEAIKVIFSP